MKTTSRRHRDRGTRLGLARGAAIFAVLASSSVAYADPAPARTDDTARWPTVRVMAPVCEASAFPAYAFLRLLDVELLSERMRTAKDSDAAPSVELTVTIEGAVCDPASHDLVVRLRRNDWETEVKRFVELGDVAPNARPRALALAVAEQIRQTRADKAPGTKPPPPDGQAPPQTPPVRTGPGILANEAAPPPAPPARASHDIGAAAAWRTFMGRDTTFLGASAAFSLPVGPAWLRTRADLAGLFTSFSDPLGSADVRHFSAGLSLLATSRGSPSFHIGPRVEFGIANVVSRVEVNPVTWHAGTVPTLLASLTTGIWIPIDAKLAAVLEAEAGIAALGVSVMADQRTMGALQGGFTTLRAGVAFAY